MIVVWMRIVFVALMTVMAAMAADWPDWRGPTRDGRSPEKNLPVKWSPAGENLAWRAPYGGRSTPVVLNNRVFVLNTSGKGETLRERVMCLDGDTGKVIWEYAYPVFLSDVPPHRAAWSSPAADPETGNVYTFGVGGELHAFSRDGKLLWERSLAEEAGLVTTHGGRTVSPVVEGPLVIVSGVTTGWGEQARAAHRFIALDKRTGEIQWVSAPGGRPFDTTYSPPVVATIDGIPTFLAGGSDGAVHAIKLWTGEPLWTYEMSKRGLNTGVVLNAGTAIVSHSEENLDSSEMGLLAAVDARARGKVGKEQIKWHVTGFQGGFSSPVIDGDRLYQVDNGANLYAFDVNTGKTLWKQNLGTIQKASAVLADGKIYVGSENGKFWVLKPGQERVEVLSENHMAEGEQIIASVAVSDGRVFLVTSDAIYCIGKKTPSPTPKTMFQWNADASAKPAFLQVSPTEMVMKPGEQKQFRVRLFDASGRFIRDDKPVSFTAGAPAGVAMVNATVEGLKGVARVRVIPSLPWSIDFTSAEAGVAPPYWINATGKASVRELEGNKLLVKHADNAFTKRARAFMGPIDLHDYTIEADVSAVEKRRQLGDAGVVAQRYQLALFGNHQRLELQSWQPETSRTAMVPFAMKGGTWYRLKLRVENLPDGKVRAQGKAWAVSDPEPEKWTIERVDPIGGHKGSPGIYADAPFEVYFDNIKVTANQ